MMGDLIPRYQMIRGRILDSCGNTAAEFICKLAITESNSSVSLDRPCHRTGVFHDDISSSPSSDILPAHTCWKKENKTLVKWTNYYSDRIASIARCAAARLGLETGGSSVEGSLAAWPISACTSRGYSLQIGRVVSPLAVRSLTDLTRLSELLYNSVMTPNFHLALGNRSACIKTISPSLNNCLSFETRLLCFSLNASKYSERQRRQNWLSFMERF